MMEMGGQRTLWLYPPYSIYTTLYIIQHYTITTPLIATNPTHPEHNSATFYTIAVELAAVQRCCWLGVLRIQRAAMPCCQNSKKGFNILMGTNVKYFHLYVNLFWVNILNGILVLCSVLKLARDVRIVAAL